MKISRVFLGVCLTLMAATGYSQIGINKRGVSANAAAEVNVTDKGVLLPRVEIVNQLKNTPIVGTQEDMPDGLVVIDIADKEESVLSFWNKTLNDSKGAWERLANFDRLPKTAIIGFDVKDDLFPINVSKPGDYKFLGGENIDYKILNDGHLANLHVVPNGSGRIRLGISSGVYLVEFIAVFKILEDEGPIKYFNMAYFVNFEQFVSFKYDEWKALRVERSTFSPLNEEHRVNFSNVFDLTLDEDNNDRLHYLDIGIGRAANSGYKGVFNLVGSNSYIKITKLK